MNGVNWGVVAAFLGPLIVAMGMIGGAVGWFVKVQIKLVTEVLKTRLDSLEASHLVLQKNQSDLQKAQMDQSLATQKALMDQAVTMARIEGKISSGASVNTPSA